MAFNASEANPVLLSAQRITVPPAGRALFVDLNEDRRSDLLVLDPVQKTVVCYWQRPYGFTNSPDQTLTLPPRTAWIIPLDVEASPGLELVFSTATGVFYSRQHNGGFEAENRMLIKAEQVFTNVNIPLLTTLSTNSLVPNATNLIAVISAEQVVLYSRNPGGDWRAESPVPLDVKRTSWQVTSDSWMMGAGTARGLQVRHAIRSRSSPDRKLPDNEAVRKILDDMKSNSAGSPPHVAEPDVDGDGLRDLILCQFSWKMDFKTDLYIFVRRKDQQLPEQPTQILHCRGIMVSIDGAPVASPVKDLDGDGRCELVMLEPNFALTSPGGALKMLLSHGVDWLLTIRSFRRGTFPRNVDASVPVTTVLQVDGSDESPVRIQGDFNGDGRPELLFRRSDAQWNIISSTTDGKWFSGQPALAFAAGSSGYLEIKDLNNDGCADVIERESDGSVLIFLTPCRRTAGKGQP